MLFVGGDALFNVYEPKSLISIPINSRIKTAVAVMVELSNGMKIMNKCKDKSV